MWQNGANRPPGCPLWTTGQPRRNGTARSPVDNDNRITRHQRLCHKWGRSEAESRFLVAVARGSLATGVVTRLSRDADTRNLGPPQPGPTYDTGASPRRPAGSGNGRGSAGAFRAQVATLDVPALPQDGEHLVGRQRRVEVESLRGRAPLLGQQRPLLGGLHALGDDPQP